MITQKHARQIATAIKNVVNTHQLYKVMDVEKDFLGTMNEKIDGWVFSAEYGENGEILWITTQQVAGGVQ